MRPIADPIQRLECYYHSSAVALEGSVLSWTGDLGPGGHGRTGTGGPCTGGGLAYWAGTWPYTALMGVGAPPLLPS